MPNLALMIGASLIGALVAGLYLLYNDEGFNQPHAYAERNWREPPPHERPNNSRRSNESRQTVYPERYDTPITTNGRKRRRRDEENEDCVICCDAMTSMNKAVFTIPECRHRFHLKCIQGWVKTTFDESRRAESTCPNCRCVMKNPLNILRMSA